MRNYEQELENRVAFIRQLLKESGCEGIVYGNSGGKDSALVGILCKKACGNTVGILLPCATTQNYGSDTDDAIRVAEQYGIAYRTVDLSETRGALVAALEKAGVELNNAAVSNIAPRLRMTALYAVAAAEHRLVAGTGNRSEAFMGYCTKWGDAAADFNPIADLSVTEVFEFLDYLDAPETIRHKAPSAGLFEGQTDEKEMGVSYAAIDRYMDGGAVTDAERARSSSASTATASTSVSDERITAPTESMPMRADRLCQRLSAPKTITRGRFRLVENLLRAFRRFTSFQIIILGFAGVIVAGALLLMLPAASAAGAATPFTDALFTSTSAVCVTGLVVRDSGSYWSPFGQSLILLLIQIGGSRRHHNVGNLSDACRAEHFPQGTKRHAGCAFRSVGRRHCAFDAFYFERDFYR